MRALSRTLLKTRSSVLASIALAAIALVAISAPAIALEQSPDALIKTTTESVLKEFDQNRDVYSADRSKLYGLVSDKVLPYMDFKRMSRMVLARHWKKATPEQQAAFTDAFKTLLVRTYATALFEYTGQPIEYLPFRMGADAEDVVVKTAIQAEAGPDIPLNYSLARNADGTWSLYDVSIDGISLVTNYRSSYSRQIKQKGLDGLVKLLEQKNAELSGG